MMRHCDKVAIANRSNMANSFCGATFETNPSGILKRPSHYVMDLYAKHARPLPLKLESPSNGPDIFACASLDKKSVTVFAVNSKDEPVDLKLTGSGFEKLLHLLRAESVCDVQDARQPEIMNHWTAPERVKTVRSETSRDAVILPAFSATAMECGF
jgi:alpha-L-arabinofuranosidase